MDDENDDFKDNPVKFKSELNDDGHDVTGVMYRLKHGHLGHKRNNLNGKSIKSHFLKSSIH